MLDIPLARKVYEFLRANPQSHDQNVWVATSPSCGTVSCIAGTTVLFSGYDLVYSSNVDGVEQALGYTSMAFGIVVNGQEIDDISVVAQDLLGICDATAVQLFYLCGGEEEALEYLAVLIDNAERVERERSGSTDC